jgi:putative endonuclease
MTGHKKDLGAKGEKFAVRYLKSKGYRILECNYRVRLGEIDIIAEQDKTLVFVEVKTRTDTLYGSPFESVTFKKQQQLSRVALEYLSTGEGLGNRPARFDVVGVRLNGCNTEYKDAEIELLQNAFDLC